MSKLSRDKGANAERDVINLLNPVVEAAYAHMRRDGYAVGPTPLLQRNTLQAHKGGTDIVGMPWAAFEVKHHTALALPEWWRQTTAQAEKLNAEPILIYRRTGGPWHVRVNCKLPIAPGHQYTTYADIDWRHFLVWFRLRCMYEAHLQQRRSEIV